MVAALTGSVAGLGVPEARTALATARVTKGVALRQLDDYLVACPRALHEPGDLPPLPLVRLASVLADSGYAVARSRCARCGTTGYELRHRRVDGRLCDDCARTDRSRQCGRCGRTRRIEASTPEGGICGRCRSADPDRHEECAQCGRIRRVTRRLPDGAALCQSCHQRPPRACVDCGRAAPVQAVTVAGPVCRSCYPAHQPRRTCGRCGQLRRIARRATAGELDLCTGCYHGVEADCVICGRRRPGHRYQGQHRCPSCIPRPARECARCHRAREVQAEWPIGPVCRSCYSHLRNHPAPCAGCRAQRVLIGADADGHPLCGPCAGARDYTCTGCGRSGHIYADAQCGWCVLADRIHDLLTGPDGQTAKQLIPLRDALADTDRPESVLAWLRSAPSARLLARLAHQPEPLSHDLLDQFPPGASLHYIREVLVLSGVLEPRDEYLDRIGPWLRQLLAELPTEHLNLLQPFAHWNVLHRARQKTRRHGPRTAAAAGKSRTLIVTAARFLTWLDEHLLTLDGLTQPQLDQWLTTPASYHLRRFIQWSNGRRLTHNLNVPARPRDQPSRFLPEEQRWAQLRRCLTDDTVPVKVRVAGALILLLGITITRLRTLTVDDVAAIDNGEVRLTVAKTPIELPPRLGVLVTRLAEQSSPPSALRRPDGPALLFPGRPPTRPIHPAVLSRVLIQHGLTPHTGRNAALIDLVSDLPAPILADLLGLHAGTAVKWAKLAKRDWTSYLAARLDQKIPDNRTQ